MAPFPLKIALHMGRSGPPSNTWFLGPTRVHIPNDISIGSAIIAWLTIVTDRQTDHATPSVTIGCIYIRTAMQPNNNDNKPQIVVCVISLSNAAHESHRACPADAVRYRTWVN